LQLEWSKIWHGTFAWQNHRIDAHNTDVAFGIV